MDKEKKRLSDRLAAKKYRFNNAEKINTEGRKARLEKNGGIVKQHRRYGKNGIEVFDTTTKETFKYVSVKACSLDMYIPIRRIYTSLHTGKVIKGYIFKGEHSKLTDEEIQIRKEAEKAINKKYYDKNAKQIRENKTLKYAEKHNGVIKEYNRGGKSGLIMVDTTTNEEFDYKSIRECSEDMDISFYYINKGLKEGTTYNGYQFKRRNDI